MRIFLHSPTETPLSCELKLTNMARQDQVLEIAEALLLGIDINGEQSAKRQGSLIPDRTSFLRITISNTNSKRAYCRLVDLGTVITLEV